MSKIVHLAKERGEKLGQGDIAKVVDALSSYNELGEIKAVMAVALLNGDRSYAGFVSGLNRMEKLALLGAIEEIKALITDDCLGIELLPEK